MGDVSLNIKGTERVIGLNLIQNTRQVVLAITSNGGRQLALNVLPTKLVKEPVTGPSYGSGIRTETKFEKILGSGLNFVIELIEVPIVFSTLTFYKPTGENVSVSYKYTDKIYIYSNVNLLNHKVIFN